MRLSQPAGARVAVSVRVAAVAASGACPGAQAESLLDNARVEPTLRMRFVPRGFLAGDVDVAGAKR